MTCQDFRHAGRGRCRARGHTRGASAIEVGLLLGLVAVVAFIAVGRLGGSVASPLRLAAETMQAPVLAERGPGSPDVQVASPPQAVPN